MTELNDTIKPKRVRRTKAEIAAGLTLEQVKVIRNQDEQSTEKASVSSDENN